MTNLTQVKKWIVDISEENICELLAPESLVRTAEVLFNHYCFEKYGNCLEYIF